MTHKNWGYTGQVECWGEYNPAKERCKNCIYGKRCEEQTENLRIAEEERGG